MPTYSSYKGQATGMTTTGTGLDQVLGWISRDPGLAGANDGQSITAGIDAVNSLNKLLVEGLQAIGSWDKPVLTYLDIVNLNAWFRADAERLASFTLLHGNDENGEETGFHHLQNDGGNTLFDGKTLIDTVLDGIFHVGFPISTDGTRLTNEDGTDNATIADVARWLTALKADLTSTATDLDRIVNTVVGDPGLQAALSWADIQGGAEAADRMNQLILNGIAAMEEQDAADGDTSRLSAEEVSWINAWIRSDSTRLNQFIADHGDDENGSETGFHLVQNDGATTRLFGRNAVNTVYDGIYHIGFTINADGRFENEDGNANAAVTDVAEWLTYYYGDPSTTGTGLDAMVDWMRLDPGLARSAPAKDINDGLAAANDLNQLLLDAIDATDVNLDGWISRYDLRTISSWVQEYHYATFVELHGDDEDGIETGFHLIQNDGGSTQFFSRNLINTVADGIYHYGFQIIGENFVNEDGNNNQSLSDVSGWLNYFLADSRLTVGTTNSETLVGNEQNDQVLASSGDDVVDGLAGDDLLDGGWGKDTLRGGSGSDLLDGGFSDDWLDGGADADTYLVGGITASGFNGYDTYADSGDGAGDQIRAEGTGPVDVGLRGFSAASGIESIINATTGGAQVRLLDSGAGNILDFLLVELVGGNILIDAAGGNDSVTGSAAADRILGGTGNDNLNGAAGGDTLTGGAGLDILTGSDGADTFVYTTLTDGIVGGSSSSRTFERITDFTVGLDSFDVTAAPAAGAFKTLGAVGGLTNTAISNLLNSTNFVANGAATFTFGSGSSQRTFVAFNDAAAGYIAATDAVLEITGYTFAADVHSLAQLSIL